MENTSSIFFPHPFLENSFPESKRNRGTELLKLQLQVLIRPENTSADVQYYGKVGEVEHAGVECWQ